MDRSRQDSGRESPHRAADAIKAKISFSDVLAHYGVSLDSRGWGHCPFPKNHKIANIFTKPTKTLLKSL